MHTTITTRLVRQSLENVLLGMTCRWVVIADLKSIRLCQSICTMVEVVSSGCAHAAVADNDHRRYDSALDCRPRPTQAVYVPLASRTCHKEFRRSQIHAFGCVLWLHRHTLLTI